MLDFRSPSHQDVGDERAMAPPRDGLCAHEGGPAFFCLHLQRSEPFLETRGLHVVGKATKARVPPGIVGRILQRMAETPEAMDMQVLNTLAR